MKSVLLFIFVALTVCHISEASVSLLFANTLPDSLTMEILATSPASTSVSNIGFGTTPQPFLIGSASVIVTKMDSTPLCKFPIQSSDDRHLAMIATCQSSTLTYSCVLPFPAPSYSNAIPAITTLRLLHASQTYAQQPLIISWQSGDFNPIQILNTSSIGQCSGWVSANTNDWNGNSTLALHVGSLQSTPVAVLDDFYTQSGSVISFIAADYPDAGVQLLPFLDGLVTAPIV